MGQEITPCLWFDNNAEEAMDLYLSVFENSEQLEVSRYGEEGPGPAGSVMVAKFRLGKQEFMALNCAPRFTFTEAISFQISCKNQEEVDHFWNKLSDGGETSQCGWLKDRFGLSWQVVPSRLGELLGGEDPAGSERAMQAMLQMTKLDIGMLERAYAGE